MKKIKALLSLLVILMLTFTNAAYAQKGRANHGHQKINSRTKVIVHNNKRGHKKTVIYKSNYRPKHIIIYHPHWAAKRNYNRRWVYFPRHNFYWDNWRQGYYYKNELTWVFNTTPPPIIVNVNIEKETNYELNENEDDVDDVYKINEVHQSELKPE